MVRLTDERRDLAARWDGLACKLGHKAYRRAVASVPRPAELDDVLSAARMALCLCARTYDPERPDAVPFPLYAYGTVWREAMTEAFGNRKVKSVYAHPECDFDVGVPLLGLMVDERRQESAEDWELADHLLRSLNARERLVIDCHLAGKTTGEIAAILGRSKQRAQQIISRAMTRMRRLAGTPDPARRSRKKVSGPAAAAIRARKQAGESYASIARDYGVSRMTAYLAASGAGEGVARAQ